ncbi:hypothetical protein [Streptomyces rishiriensis]|uniref:HTH IS21-type domain-containing protein n=1 Tax=Streptomyces rishiriensis TaxID=68264 RepID=A0ABU0P3I6_STRRH|nr:hypothetical protein [Streptomyces rishiriensis]MDQ0585503.1 hypothetical protein [Streptomyces rishiriensis]
MRCSWPWSLAAWLTERPGIEIVCRDRAPFFADGVARGAPQALQVADPMGSLAQPGRSRREVPLPAPRLLAPRTGTIGGTPGGAGVGRVIALADRPPVRRSTRAKHATIHALLAAGHSKRSVARRLGMTLNTILRFSRATTPEKMYTGQWQNRATRLDAYKPYLDQRW